LKGENDSQTMLLENEFIMQEWRIMRFLRAIFDVRINMEKQSIADFVEWAHKETDLSEKMIYNQTWIFLESVGYAPCYSIAGDKISKLQQQALKKRLQHVHLITGLPTPRNLRKKNSTIHCQDQEDEQIRQNQTVTYFHCQTLAALSTIRRQR